MKKQLALTFACLLASFSAFATLEGEMKSGYNLPYLWDSTSGYTNTDWMSAIPDDMLLSQFSIPGTHNSLSLYGGDVPQTQTLGVTEQLEMGIRYLDVRFLYRGADLRAYHGLISQYQTFDEFLNKVSLFLDANPSETVLIRMQNEAGAELFEDIFYHRFQEVLDKYRHNNVVPTSDNPELGSIRGKFVFIRDFNVKQRIGIERANLHIQDQNVLNTNYDLHKKWDSIKAHFNTINGDKISLNHLSGSQGSFPYFVASGKSSPGSHAPQLWTGVSTTDRGLYPDFPRRSCLGSLCSIYFAGTNQLTNSWIEAGKFSGNLGIVAMDFPGARLVNNIIQSNARFSTAETTLVIYEDKNQSGESLRIYFDMPDLSTMNDKMSSWYIPQGWEVRFYEHINYQGGYYTRGAGRGNADGFDNKISSIRILAK